MSGDACGDACGNACGDTCGGACGDACGDACGGACVLTSVVGGDADDVCLGSLAGPGVGLHCEEVLGIGAQEGQGDRAEARACEEGAVCSVVHVVTLQEEVLVHVLLWLLHVLP